jgi:predicted transcriptional regulator of viral defense system
MSEPSGWTGALALAEDQWGLVTRQQVEALGVAWSTLARHVRRGVVERVAHGVYRIRGAAEPPHLGLRSAWLQLCPAVPAWERTPGQGTVSHRAAAALYGFGHLPADVHEFTLEVRKQTRRDDVRLHRGPTPADDVAMVEGLPVTRPHRIAADLMADREDPGAVAAVITDALRARSDSPASFARALAPSANAFGLRRGDGPGMLRWLLELAGEPESEAWLNDAIDNASDRTLATRVSQ